MIKRIIPSLSICLSVLLPMHARCASIMSSYGQIQNVQNYSTNPFWTPNGGYKQNFPRPVYALGTDLSTADCAGIVAALVAIQCSRLDNCANARISDIRPSVLLELSRLPGHNYASACAGYLDAEFDKYVTNNAYAIKPAAFPIPTDAAYNDKTDNEFKIKNPYQQNPPQWLTDYKARENELKQLQQNSPYK